MTLRHSVAGEARRLRASASEGVKAHLRMRLKAKELSEIQIRDDLGTSRIVAVLVVKNEAMRLPFILKYYRALGIEHFIVVDNQSDDGTVPLLMASADVSLYGASGSYGSSRYGNDWVNEVCRRHCVGKWVLYSDADEFLVVPHHESIGSVCDVLEQRSRRALHTVMVDLYSERLSNRNLVATEQDPLDVCDLYDCAGYTFRHEAETRTTWIKGGVRARVFFSDPEEGPALNKTPLVQWRRSTAFLKSAHQLWPLKLNADGDRPQGAILHFKFTSVSTQRILDQDQAQQHTAEYAAYANVDQVSFVGPHTRRYRSPLDFVREGMVTTL